MKAKEAILMSKLNKKNKYFEGAKAVPQSDFGTIDEMEQGEVPSVILFSSALF